MAPLLVPTPPSIHFLYCRLLTAAFVHVDATHLITNLTAALPEVLALEDTEGSKALAVDLLLLTLLSHGLYGGYRKGLVLGLGGQV